MFAHHWKDSVLVLLSVLGLTGYYLGAFYWDRFPWQFWLAMGVLQVFLTCTNYQCVAHNFLHNPFFRSRTLNNLFSLLNSITLGMPQTLYKYHHLNHHRFNNDPLDPATGTTHDESSTYRHARRPGQEEGLLSYALLGPIRMNLVALYRDAKAHRRARLVWAEAITMTISSSLLLALNWRYFVCFILPVWYLGQAAALAENYLEHHHAIPGNRLTDSVSCYGRLYNWIWFNNGYHQEHHYRPQAHWTEVPQLRAEMLPEDQRRVVRGAHWFNF